MISAGEVAVGRGDDADIDLDPAAADALEGLLLQGAHDLALGFQRHVGDLVEEQRAAMRLLEGADLARAVGPRRPASVPNSSISSRSGRMVAQFNATKGPRRASSAHAAGAPPPPCRCPARR